MRSVRDTLLSQDSWCRACNSVILVDDYKEEINKISRRTFTATLLNSLLTFSLLNMACERDLFAQAIKPIIDRWLKNLHQLCGDLRSNKVSQVQWQQQVIQLFSRIELSDLLRFIDFDRLDKQMMIPTDSVAVGQAAPWKGRKGVRLDIIDIRQS